MQSHPAEGGHHDVSSWSLGTRRRFQCLWAHRASSAVLDVSGGVVLPAGRGHGGLSGVCPPRASIDCEAGLSMGLDLGADIGGTPRARCVCGGGVMIQASTVFLWVSCVLAIGITAGMFWLYLRNHMEAGREALASLRPRPRCSASGTGGHLGASGWMRRVFRVCDAGHTHLVRHLVGVSSVLAFGSCDRLHVCYSPRLTPSGVPRKAALSADDRRKRKWKRRGCGMYFLALETDPELKAPRQDGGTAGQHGHPRSHVGRCPKRTIRAEGSHGMQESLGLEEPVV